MKRIIVSILAAGAAALAIAAPAHAEEYGRYERWRQERYAQARRRFLEHRRHERLERGYSNDRW